MRPIPTAIPATFLAVLLAWPAWASPAPQPEQITFQGRLTDAAGNPVTADVGMTFSVYDVASNGIALWSETQTVSVSGGLYSVQLGFTKDFTDLTLDMTNGRWLGVKVGSDPEMTPRYPLTGALYAHTAITADLLDGLHASAFAAAVHTHDTAAIVSGVFSAGVGGTGVTGSGGASHFLRADGTSGWTSGPILPADLPAGSGNYLARNAADTSSASCAGTLYDISNMSSSTGGIAAIRGRATATDAPSGDFTGIIGTSNVGDNAAGLMVTNVALQGSAAGASTVVGADTSNFGLQAYATGDSPV